VSRSRAERLGRAAAAGTALAVAVAMALGAAPGAGAQRARDLPALDIVLPAADVWLVSSSLDGAVQVAESPGAVEITLAADALFPSGGASLDAGARRRLAEVASRIRRARPPRVQIDGHTDGRGSAAAAVRRSRRRAEAVADVLEEALGAAAPVFDTAGRGARAPVVAEERPDGSDDRRGRARNERITVRFDR
jgi:outer membrane protein OmpA-like peptidoglycan-associated protein